MRELEPWEPEPKDCIEMVFGSGVWAPDTDVQQVIGPEFLMYHDAQHFPLEEPLQRFP